MTATAMKINLPAIERDLLDLLDRVPGNLPINGKAVHHRLTGSRGTLHDQAVTASHLDQLAINGLARRTGGYLGTPGKFYTITDAGHSALRA